MTSNEKVWVIDDDRSIRWVLEKALSGAGMDVTCFEDGSTILDRLSREQPDVIISDIRMPGMNGIELLEKINYEHPEVPVIIITAHSDLDSALSAYQGGAFEYLPKPFDVDEAVVLVQRAFKQRNKTLQKQGATLDATFRKFDDTRTDDLVRINVGAWVLFSRFFDALPQANLGLVVPGFMLTAQSNGNNIFYCGMEKDFEYFAGYFYTKSQFSYIKDNITTLREYPDRLIVFCKNSTHEIPLNNFQIEEISSIGVSITTIVGQNVVDTSIGDNRAIRYISLWVDEGIHTDR